jgi:L,D-transpeptidase YcbB
MSILTSVLVSLAALSLTGLGPLGSAGDATSQVSAAHTAPLWFTDGHPTRQAVAIVSQMRNAEEVGLRPADYGVAELTRAIPELAEASAAPAAGAAVAVSSSVAPTREDIASADAWLTLAIARFVSDLHFGRIDPHQMGYELDIERPKFDLASALGALAHAPSVAAMLEGLEPQFLHYRLLKSALVRYRELTQHPELNLLPDPGKTAIKPGGFYVGAAGLRKLLLALGDLPATAAAGSQAATVSSNEGLDTRLDQDLVGALRTFQARHGLQQNGSLGRDTYRALTMPFTERVKEIELSMERWRWLPSKLETPSIIVNIPQFRLFALYTTADFEQQMLEMDVIVGKSFTVTQTPVFAADMRYIVLHPYWDIPYSILSRDLLPSILRDPNYITRNDYEIVAGESDAAAAQPVTPKTIDGLAKGSLRLRQRPGPRNPLGFVKFMLPNKHNVYLHGTPTPALFGGTRRAFSHGCIRIADPMGLLNYVLRNNPEWDDERILAQMEHPEPYQINLRTPTRVFIVYATALVAEDGRALFFRDIYGEDAKLQALLEAHSRRLSQPKLLGP